MRTRYWSVCRPDLRAQGQVVMAGPKFVFGMLSKGPAASRSRGTGLARCLMRWWLPPYLSEAPKTVSTLFCFPPTHP